MSQLIGGDNYPEEVMERHYAALMKEMKKLKPNKRSINTYLNKEFEARQAWVSSIEPEGPNRCEMFLSKYPCFKDHVEVQHHLSLKQQLIDALGLDYVSMCATQF